MTIHVDTSALIDALTGPRRSLPRLVSLTSEGHRLQVSTVVLYEWLRGPRTTAELAAQESLFPQRASVPFSTAEAVKAAALYRDVKRARGREIDLAVAACALVADASLWTLNQEDFRDISGLRLI